MSEQEIINLCQKGKLENFTFLYDKYVNKIYKFVYLKTFDREMSEDLTSQTFLKSISKIKTFKNNKNANFKAWIYRIAHNLVIDNYKTKKTSLNLDEIIETGYSEDFGKNIDNKEKLKEIFNYFNTLNQKHKEILIMRLWEDLSYKEISELTNETVNNCKKIVSRTLKKVPKELVYLIFIFLF